MTLLALPDTWRLPYDPARRLGDLPSLLTSLEQCGCTIIPGVGAYRELLDLTPGSPTPIEDLGPLLDASPTQVMAWAADHAHAVAVRQGTAEALKDARTAAGLQLIRRLRERADELLDQLRPGFSQAAAAGRRVLSFGVPPAATAEQVIALGEPGAAWLEFKQVHAPLLSRIARLRVHMSAVLGVPPGGNRSLVRSIDFGAAFGVATLPAPTVDKRAEHVLWLELAPELRLATIAQSSPVEAPNDGEVDR